MNGLGSSCEARLDSRLQLWRTAGRKICHLKISLSLKSSPFETRPQLKRGFKLLLNVCDKCTLKCQYSVQLWLKLLKSNWQLTGPNHDQMQQCGKVKSPMRQYVACFDFCCCWNCILILFYFLYLGEAIFGFVFCWLQLQSRGLERLKVSTKWWSCNIFSSWNSRSHALVPLHWQTNKNKYKIQNTNSKVKNTKYKI